MSGVPYYAVGDEVTVIRDGFVGEIVEVCLISKKCVLYVITDGYKRRTVEEDELM